MLLEFSHFLRNARAREKKKTESLKDSTFFNAMMAKLFGVMSSRNKKINKVVYLFSSFLFAASLVILKHKDSNNGIEK